MIYARDGTAVSRFMQAVHSGISRIFNETYKLPHRFNWHSRKCFFITDDDMYWGLQGYIIGNLLKHKEVSTFKELNDCPYSSFRYIADKYGFDFACNLVRNVIYVEEDAWGIVKLNDLDKCDVVRPRPQAWLA